MDTNDIIMQLTAERDRIDAAIKLLSDSGSAIETKVRASGKRKPMSAAARKKIGDAQRKRWAAAKNGLKAIPAKAANEAAPLAKQGGKSTAARTDVLHLAGLFDVLPGRR